MVRREILRHACGCMKHRFSIFSGFGAGQSRKAQWFRGALPASGKMFNETIGDHTPRYSKRANYLVRKLASTIFS
jgi:hypothetical protein